MNEKRALETVDKIFKDIYGRGYTGTFDDLIKKYAYDVSLPSEVVSSLSNQTTWSATPGGHAYAKFEELMVEMGKHDWLFPAEKIESYEQLINLWQRANYSATERMLESIDITESDTVYGSEKIFRSRDIHGSKNIICSDSLYDSEFVFASQRGGRHNFCIRVEDSWNCSSSYDVNWCKNIVKSMFISDASNLFECIMCSHMMNQRFCIANMQYEEAEYFRIKEMIIEWIFSQR